MGCDYLETHYPTYSSEIFISNGDAIERGSEIFLNVCTNFSVKGLLKAIVSVSSQIKNYLYFLELL